MALNKIEILLERYFEGDTSLEQEAQLRDYFTSDEVVSHLEEYRPLFTAFAEAKKERFNRKIELPKEKRNIQWIPIAAGILLCIGLFLTFNKNKGSEHDLGTYKDPDVAVMKTKQALFMMGNFMNKGTSQLNNLDTFEETTNEILK